jgi:tetratricopeptide (TPR) repeat protein
MRALRAEVEGRPGISRWTVPLVVTIITFVAFLPALQAGFVTWDDDTNFLKNPDYRGLGIEQLRWMWTTFHLGHYVPLSWMTLGLDYVVWGMDPFGYHLSSLILHCANAVLVYVLALRLLALAPALEATHRRRTLCAAIAALFFSIHPLRVESVTWITERRDVLSMLFMLGATLAYLRSTTRAGDWKRQYSISIVLFAAALLSKATVVTLPVALIVLNVFPLRRLTFDHGVFGAPVRRVLIELAPFFAMSAAIGVLSIVALSPGDQLSLLAKISLTTNGIVFYLWKTLWPTGLAPLYEIPRDYDPLAIRYIIAFVTVLVLVVAAWRARTRWPAVTTAAAVFGIILLPLLGIVQNGPQYAADRYTYHASPALAILVGAGLVTLPAARGRFAAMVAGVALSVLAVLTWRQNAIWRTPTSMWERVLAVGESSIARTGIGNTLVAEGRTDESIAHYRRSLELDPYSTEALNNLGVALARLGQFDEAIVQYKRTVDIKADHFEAFNNWGVALSQLGRFDDAIERFDRALRIKPDYADAQVNWGNALVRQGKPREAMAHYAAALRINAGFVAAHLNGGVALAQLGDAEAAARAFQRVLTLDPGNAEATEYLRRLRTP